MHDLRAQHARVGPADRLARRMSDRLQSTTVDDIYAEGLHQFLEDFIAENDKLSGEIAQQFSF